jgi:hypothetical protein
MQGRSAGEHPAGSSSPPLMPNERYEKKSLHSLFKFSGAKTTRRIPHAQLPFREGFEHLIV